MYFSMPCVELMVGLISEFPVFRIFENVCLLIGLGEVGGKVLIGDSEISKSIGLLSDAKSFKLDQS